MRFVKAIFKYFRPKSEREMIEDYLSRSTDLVDLERRQRQLTYGINPNLKGWV